VERLKRELLMIGKDRGDTGSTEDQQICIDWFFEALQRYMTQEAIASFTADQLRLALIAFVNHINTHGDVEQSQRQVIYLLHPSAVFRKEVRCNPPQSANVVGMFDRVKKKS